MHPTFNQPFHRRTTVQWHGLTIAEDGQRSVTLSVNGQRHRYTLTPPQCDTVEYLCKRVSGLKALAFAKSRALASERLT